MNFLLTIAILASAIWGIALVVRGSLLAGCLVFLTLTMCFGHEFFNVDLGPIPLTLDRIWIGLLLVMFVAQTKLRRTDPKPVAWVEIVLFVFLALLSISTAIYGPMKPKDAPAIWHLVVAYFFPAVLYWVARQSVLTESRVTCVHGFLALLGVYLGVTGIAEMTGQWSLVFPAYIADPKVGLHFGRARGPMVQSVSYGLFLGICIISTMLWAQRFSRPGKLVLLLLVPIELVAVGLTLTRSVWIGTALALLVFALLVLSSQWRKLVLFGAVAASLLIVTTKLDTLTGFQREGTAQDTRSSAESRASFVYVSWKMFQDRPLFGFGFGQFSVAKLPYLDDRTTDLNLEIIRPLSHHNTYLSLLVEVGLLGFLLYMTLLGLWAHYAWRLYRGPRRPAWARAQGILTLSTMATYATQMLFHDVSFTSVDNAILFLLAGMTVGLSYDGTESRRMDRGRGEEKFKDQRGRESFFVSRSPASSTSTSKNDSQPL